MKCKKRFTTYERIGSSNITVIKKDKKRELFDRSKLIIGLAKACEKRPVGREEIERIADKVELRIKAEGDNEVSSKIIGNMAMKELLKLDPVAYIRFASVYNDFGSPEEFIKALSLFKGRDGKKKAGGNKKK